MKALAKYLWFRLLLLPLCVSVAFAQTNPPEQIYSQAELDQMLAPIALYPDSLLSQILMAATYPLEVVQAARWSRANSALKGEQAAQCGDYRQRQYETERLSPGFKDRGGHPRRQDEGPGAYRFSIAFEGDKGGEIQGQGKDRP